MHIMYRVNAYNVSIREKTKQKTAQYSFKQYCKNKINVYTYLI